MRLEEIPLYTVLPEVEQCVIDLLLDRGDCATMLGGENYGLRCIEDLRGTEYADIVPAFVSRRADDGSEHGMAGTVYEFVLTEELKAHIRNEGLACMFRAEGSDMPLLENLALYRGGKRIFSCVSHEVFCLYGMSDIDDGLAEEISRAVEMTIARTPLYAAMSKINDGLYAKTDKTVEKETEILFDLHCYVDEANKRWIYQPPRHKCGYARFCKIAKDYLTSETLETLTGAKDFGELQSLPVAHTVDEALAGVGKDAPQFLNTELYRRLNRELCVLKYIRDKN